MSKRLGRDGPGVMLPWTCHIVGRGRLAYLGGAGAESVDVLAAARFEMPGSCGREPLVEVELGRETGSGSIADGSPSMPPLSSRFSVEACISARDFRHVESQARSRCRVRSRNG